MRLVLLTAALVLVACAPSRATSATGRDALSQTAPAATKTLTLGQLAAITAFTPEAMSSTGGGAVAFADVYSSGLTTADARGTVQPRIAASLPALDDGSIVVLPDGHMRTTWKLRNSMRWHDGAPFSADDIVFSWEILHDPNVLVPGAGQALKNQVESAEAPDASTVVLTWKTTYVSHLNLGTLQLFLYPRHLLGDSFTGDKQLFLGQPFFTTGFVGVGPFRMLDFGNGETLVFERFDNYFLGPARVNRVVIRAIDDPNVLLTNLRAGIVDVVAEATLSANSFIELKNEWASNRGGSVMSRQDFWWYFWVQMDPGIAQPAELARDPRIRRGLLSGVDRAALREFLFPGIPGTSADTFMLDADPRRSVVGEPFSRYPYDPARAAAELADAGWRTGADRRLIGLDGKPVQLEIRSPQTNQPELGAVAADWRKLGLDVNEWLMTTQQARDSEYQAHFPSFLGRSRGTAESIFPNFDGRTHSTAANRWNGANHGHYANPELDRLIDAVSGTLDTNQQAMILKQMADVMATDLPALPMYFRISFAAAVRGVQALDDYPGSGTTGPGLMSRSILQWDRE
ncbi:MAG TPA: ABC transporter substrate-binding protein [Chloroflexota bacterium]